MLEIFLNEHTARSVRIETYPIHNLNFTRYRHLNSSATHQISGKSNLLKSCVTRTDYLVLSLVNDLKERLSMTVALCSGPNNPDDLNFDDVITKVYNPNTVLIGGIKKNVTICVSYRGINYEQYPAKERETSVYEVMYRYKVQQVTYLITLRITNQRGVRSDYSEGSGTANGTNPMPYTCSMIPVYKELDKYNEYNPGTTPRTINGGPFPSDQFTPDNGDDYFGLPHWYDIEYKIDTGDTNTGGGTGTGGSVSTLSCNQNSNIDNAEQTKIKGWLREYFPESQWGYAYCDSGHCVRTVCIGSNVTIQLTLVSFWPSASDQEINRFISDNGWPTTTKITRVGFNLNDAPQSMKNSADDPNSVELCPFSQQIAAAGGYVENYGRWIYREVDNSLDCGGSGDYCTADASKYTAAWYKDFILKNVPCEKIPPNDSSVPKTFQTTVDGIKYTLLHVWGEAPWGMSSYSKLITIADGDVTPEYANCANLAESEITGSTSFTWREQWWVVCKEEPVEVAPAARRCCTCGSGSTNVLMDNFVFAVNDQWFNDTLAQYVETGAFAARLLPSNGATPNAIAPQWILTLKGCTTNPTKPEVRRKMDVYLKSIKEFLTESGQKYKNFDETQVIKIIAAYNGSEFGIKMEDCNGTIATVVVTREICPKAGEELSTYCVEFDRWKSYTDGNCGVYHQLVKANSEDCGYVPCEPAGRKMETYCEGFDQWAFFTDGNCGKTPVKLHENSEDCGYIPCDKRGTVTGTKCKGFDLYDIVADGDCGTEDVLNTPNSPDCGYVPCDPAGIEKRRYCEGKDQYAEYTDGNCGVTRQLIMTNSPDCGYGPTCPDRGTIQRTYCSGTTKMGVYHDGACKTYEGVIENNSVECGYSPPRPARNVAILTKSRTPTDDPRSGEWPTSAVMVGIRTNSAYYIQIAGRDTMPTSDSEWGTFGVALATFGWDATPNIPDKHIIEILDSSGSVLVSHMIDSGSTDYRGMSWTRGTFSIPAQSSLSDGTNYRMRICIEVGQPGSTNKAYSQTYTFALKTIAPIDPGWR